MIFVLIILLLLLVAYIWSFVAPKKKKLILFQHICITGGSSGIGKALAIEAAGQGAHVTIIARDPVKLQSSLQQIKEARISDKQQFKYCSIDCTDSEAVEEGLKQLDRALPIDIFVNCAGYAQCGIFESVSPADIRQQFDVNYFATVYPLRIVIPLMKERNHGTVVITSSQGGLCGIYGYSIYASTKFALRGLAEVLAMECRDYNISVTLCLPPDTDTPGFETENLSKPNETKLISGAAGLYQPEVVAKQLLNDALNHQFFSCVGFESYLMTTLCVGMAPFRYFYEVVIQAVLLGPFRLISSYYINDFQKIITNCKMRREVDSKKE